MGEGHLSAQIAARFAASWHAIAPPGKVGLAVSGGPDSVALLLLMNEVAPRNFHVVTVDHGLRSESASEAVMVAALCAARSIPHTTLTLTLAKGSALQERARNARYAAMAQWAHAAGIVALVTAHHADDQAETMVMRLNRGAGVRGVAGMRAISTFAPPEHHKMTILRPLLHWRRAGLVEVVENAQVIAADDPSNRDPVYERVRIRAAMTSTRAFEIKGFVASASHFADADAALQWAADKLWAEVVPHGDGFTWNAPADVPRALALRLLERVLKALGAPTPRGPSLLTWLETLSAGGVSTLGGVKGDARFGPWRFTRAPARRR